MLRRRPPGARCTAARGRGPVPRPRPKALYREGCRRGRGWPAARQSGLSGRRDADRSRARWRSRRRRTVPGSWRSTAWRSGETLPRCGEHLGCCSRARFGASACTAPNSLMSAPAAKARSSAPRITATRTSPSRSTSSSRAARPCHMARVKGVAPFRPIDDDGGDRAVLFAIDRWLGHDPYLWISPTLQRFGRKGRGNVADVQSSVSTPPAGTARPSRKERRCRPGRPFCLVLLRRRCRLPRVVPRPVVWAAARRPGVVAWPPPPQERVRPLEGLARRRRCRQRRSRRLASRPHRPD